MTLPRVSDGQHEGVTGMLNATADEVDRRGTAVSVRRTSFMSLAHNMNTWIPWQSRDFDTYGGGWSPTSNNYLYAPVDGLYMITLQVRFHFVTSAGTPNGGPPYSAGDRVAGICLNGFNFNTDRIAVDRRPTAVSGEGVTLVANTLRPLRARDWMLCYAYHNGGSTLEALQPDFSGTYLAIARLGRLP